MPTLTVSSSVAAGATATPLQNQQYEFVDDLSQVLIGIVAEATGLLATIYMGRDLVQEEAPVFVVAANGLPIFPDHFFVQETVSPGTRLKIQLRNPTAGTIIAKTTLRINS